MKRIVALKACITTLAIGLAAAACASHGPKDSVELGPRPYYLVADMDAGPLKQALQECASQ